MEDGFVAARVSSPFVFPWRSTYTPSWAMMRVLTVLGVHAP